MRIAVASAFGLSLFLSALHPASAAEPSPTGIEVGVRTGYALPLGQVTGAGTLTVNGTTYQTQSLDLSKDFSGQVPIWIDAGYRITPQLYVGAYFQYGVAFLPSDAANGSCGQNGVSCSGSDVLVGANVHYHILPAGQFDPWLGVGTGYEWANFSVSQGGQSGGLQIVGWQYVNFQVGGDYKVAPNFGVGPFVMLSVGQFDSFSSSGAVQTALQSAGAPTSGDYQNKALHEWLTFGVRGAYDINL
jgi:hypothetical protein